MWLRSICVANYIHKNRLRDQTSFFRDIMVILSKASTFRFIYSSIVICLFLVHTSLAFVKISMLIAK